MTNLGSRVGTAEVTTPFTTRDPIHLISYHGVELVSGLFHFDLQLRCDDKSLTFEEAVGEHITVGLQLASGGKRHIDGIVGRFSQSGHDDHEATYFARLVPWLWLLTHSSDCRIFQELSVPDIIKKVFGDLGQTDFTDKLTGTYEPRVYCVQYNETHFDFVSRLMEEEGIYYYFEHEASKHSLVLADDSQQAAPCANASEITCIPQSELEIENSMVSCSIEENVVPGAFVHKDFNFETPSTKLEAQTTGKYGKNPSRRTIYEYPGGFGKSKAGESLGTRRIVSLERSYRRLVGESLAPALAPGFTFGLANHYRDDLNEDYLVTKVEHHAEEDRYSNLLQAIPKSVSYRPARTARKPRIPGTQTAIVVGKSGEEIWTDKYGRVKVQFHWDREGKNDDKSSCWVRVAHGWAGKSWGQVFIPRIGQEVVVSFEEGNPDKPLITGSVYNAEQTVPYPLPAGQTKSTLKTRSAKKAESKNFNELRFEDKKDEEEIFFQAERDFNRVVKNDDTLKVGFETKDKGSQKIDIFKDRTITLDKGKDKLQIKTGDRDTILDKGNYKLQLKTGNRDTILDKGNYKVQIKKGDRNISIDMGKSSTKAGKSIELKVGSSSIKIDQKGIVIKGMKVSIQGTIKAELKSVMVDVNGSAMTKIKGGILKLN